MLVTTFLLDEEIVVEYDESLQPETGKSTLQVFNQNTNRLQTPTWTFHTDLALCGQYL